MSSSTLSSRTQLGRVVAFLALVGIVLWGLGEVFQRVAARLDYNVPKIDDMMSLRGDDSDVVVLGNSMMQQSYNPEVVEQETGLTSYSLASGGQGLLASQMFLHHYLRYNDKPSLVVVGVSVNLPAGGYGVRPQGLLLLDADEQSRFESLRRDLSGEATPRSVWVFNRLKAYLYRQAVESLIKYAVLGESRVPRIVRGHVAIDFATPGIPATSERVQAGIEEAALVSLLDACEELELPVLLVEPPSSPSAAEHAVGRDEVLAIVEREAAQRQGVNFVSYERWAVHDGEWFSLNHLNARGAERMSREVFAPLVSDALRGEP